MEIVNAMLHHLQATCDGCILLTRWYAGEPRSMSWPWPWKGPNRAAGLMA
jgi:hypothetical protein